MLYNVLDNLVKNEDGSVNLDETTNRYRDFVSNWLTHRNDEDSVIANTVGNIFDGSSQGTRYTMDDLVGRVCNCLSVSPSQFHSVSSKVKTYIRLHSGERGSSLFSIKKGVGGGVGRWSDLPSEEKKA